MRPLIISTACIILLISTWGLFIYYTSNTLEIMADDLTHSVYKPTASEEWEDAAKGMQQVADNWHRNKIIIYMLSNHGVIRETDISIAKAQEFIKNEERSDALAELSVIHELFVSIRQGETFTIDNIF